MGRQKTKKEQGVEITPHNIYFIYGQHGFLDHLPKYRWLTPNELYRGTHHASYILDMRQTWRDGLWLNILTWIPFLVLFYLLDLCLLDSIESTDPCQRVGGLLDRIIGLIRPGLCYWGCEFGIDP